MPIAAYFARPRFPFMEHRLGLRRFPMDITPAARQLRAALELGVLLSQIKFNYLGRKPIRCEYQSPLFAAPQPPFRTQMLTFKHSVRLVGGDVGHFLQRRVPAPPATHAVLLIFVPTGGGGAAILGKNALAWA